MAKRSSTLRRSKVAENRVAKYLWGDEHLRDWKEAHDLSGPDADGRRWIGEVKNLAWPSGAKDLWSKLTKALHQAGGYSNLCFAVLVPVSTSITDALVMYYAEGQRVVIPLWQFRKQVLCLHTEGDS